MNTSCARAQSPPAEASRPAGRSRRVDGSEQQRSGDDFERLLRDKAATHDDSADPEDTAPRHEPDVASLACLAQPGAAPSMPAPRNATSSIALAPMGAPEPAVAAPHAALEAALNAEPDVQPLSAPRADAAGAWEVSLHEPMGVAVELRAVRPAGTNLCAGPATWTLTIASSSLDATALMRHAPRLNERLRARSLTHTHVRIDSDDGEAS